MHEIHIYFLSIITLIILFFLAYILFIPIIVNLIFIGLHNLNLYLIKKEQKRIFKYTANRKDGFLYKEDNAYCSKCMQALDWGDN